MNKRIPKIIKRKSIQSRTILGAIEELQKNYMDIVREYAHRYSVCTVDAADDIACQLIRYNEDFVL